MIYQKKREFRNREKNVIYIKRNFEIMRFKTFKTLQTESVGIMGNVKQKIKQISKEARNVV